MSENATVAATPMRERTAEEIRVQLARRRMSMSELARRIGKPQPYLSRRLTGEVALDVDDLSSIARVLGVTAGSLLPAGDDGHGSVTGKYRPAGPRTPAAKITGHVARRTTGPVGPRRPVLLSGPIAG